MLKISRLASRPRPALGSRGLAVKAALDTVEKAAAAFPAWSQTGPSERRRLLNKAADILESRTGDLTAVMARETNATPPWAGFNAHLAADMLREAAALTTQIHGEVIPSDVPGSLAMALRVPAGVSLGIAPWNAPVILATRAVAVPLACGNTAILKAAERCPDTHRIVYESIRDAGLPEGAVGFVETNHADAPGVVSAMIAHKAVKRVNFTGSTRTGTLIAIECAQYLKPVLLELGGKAPLVVLDDADLDAAVDASIFGMFANSGQICMSTERLIVDSTVADEFAEKLAARAKALPGPVVGPLVSEQAAGHVADLFGDAVTKGAKVLAGGVPSNLSNHIPATVLDHITRDMRIWTEESFGPVKGILRVSGDEEAIAMANDSEFALSSAVFSKTRGFSVAKRIESGICHVNGPTVHDEAQMPFGGSKGSGHGRFGGRWGIDAFTETRWITVQEGKRMYPF